MPTVQKPSAGWPSAYRVQPETVGSMKQATRANDQWWQLPFRLKLGYQLHPEYKL